MENNLEQLNNPEKKEFAPGRYELAASIREYQKGELVTLNGALYLYVPGTVKELEQRARSWASAVGLHNFGMDAKYPVEFSVHDQKGAEVLSFSCQFNSSGYPVNVEERDDQVQ